MYFSAPPFLDNYQLRENSMVTHRLFSLHGAYENKVMRWFDHPQFGVLNNMDKPHPSVLLADSGAFTAWKSGHKTTLDEVISAYEKFFERARKCTDEIWAINLDVIPGESGREATHEEIKEAVKQSDINYKILTDKFGPCILPVFHKGESLERALEVEYMTNKTSQYICLSPRTDTPENQRIIWSQQVIAALKKTTKSHGLATTGNNMMEKVNWHSVDSSSWVLYAIYGHIIFYWDKSIAKTYSLVTISTGAGKDRFQNRHYDSLAEPVKKAIADRAAELGFTIDELKTGFRVRTIFNMVNLRLYVDKVLSDKKLYSHQDTLFGV